MTPRAGVLGERGATNQVGVILMVGIVFVGIFSIVGFGATALSDPASDVTDETAERDFVSLAEAIDRQVIRSDSDIGTRESDLGMSDITSSSASVRALESAGELVIQVDGTTVLDDTVGLIEYENPDSDTRIGYQTGMVFTKQEGEPAAIRRTNEDQYREDGTGNGITLHVISIDEFASLGESASISVESVDDKWPDLAVAAGDTITIEITSEYDHGWARKFEQMLPDSRTTITHDTAANQVEVVYTAPGDGSFLHLLHYHVSVR
jgi:hypothetical protein